MGPLGDTGSSTGWALGLIQQGTSYVFIYVLKNPFLVPYLFFLSVVLLFIVNLQAGTNEHISHISFFFGK